jgi:hypothetical protein
MGRDGTRIGRRNVDQVVAIDWSGRAKNPSEAIWTARVTDGHLVELENGRDRAATIGAVIDLARREPGTVVGLDFAFSFPRWFCATQGWSTAAEVWRGVDQRGEQLLNACTPPFWGRSGTKAQTLGEPLRETDKAAGSAKSVFQIGGAGAVGTGSLRGIPHLITLSEAGFAIWPFDAPGFPLVVEIYPRLLTGPVFKNRHQERRRYLEDRYPHSDPVLRERAAGSEDAFDAAVSALEMWRHVEQLEALPTFPPEAPQRLEGAIWSAANGGS